MDADQGRCRRTDGKRWRCSNDVVVDEKYCERHMHRGAGNRSRKLVEDPKIVCTSDPAANIQPRSHYVEKPKSIASTSVPGRLKLKIPSPNCTIPRSGKDTTILTITSTKTPITASNKTPTAAFVTAPTATATISTSSDKRMKRNCENGMDNEGKDTHVDTGIDRENSSGNSSSVSKASAKLGFSSNSSLEGGIPVGGISLCYDHKNITETETWRCRRTDGKKWRCKNAVIPCQKYCAQHMFRGTKKHAGSSQFIAAAATM